MTDIRLEFLIDRQLLISFPEDLAIEHSVVPLRRLSRGLLLAAPPTLGKDSERAIADRLGIRPFLLPCSMEDLHRAVEVIKSVQSSASNVQKGAAQSIAGENDHGSWLGSVTAEYGLGDLEALELLISLSPEAVGAVPESIARFSRVVPIGRFGTELVVASEKFLDRPIISDIQARSGLTVSRVPVSGKGIPEALQGAYLVKAAPQPAAPNVEKTEKVQLKLGELLVKEGLLTREQLDLCLAEQQETRARLGELLIKRGYISEEATYRALAGKAGCEYRPFDTSEIDLSLSHLLSKRFAEQNLVLPLKTDRKRGELTIALTDPFDLNVQDIVEGIAAQSGYKVTTIMASPFHLHRGIAYTYETRDLVQSNVQVESILEAPGAVDGEDLIDSADLSFIKQVVNRLLYSAVIEGASDIHIENLERQVQVRFRIDGVLEERTTPLTRQNIGSVISVLKVDAKLDIAERRRSQDGVFKKRIGRDKVIDFRINIHQSQFGEDAVIRILDRNVNLLSLERLGFSPQTLTSYMRLVENPQGLILFSGPTGSGKTTTLYSTLNHLNNRSKKIVTAEDPIEYTLKGITQCQVNERIGNTFEEFAKRLMRKDPDIILIGEIRDARTAKACVNAAMTGHLVFSTLHTNDSIGAVQRLQTLDVPEASIAESLLAVISQRLARRTCTKCREEYTPEEGLLAHFYNGNRPESPRFLRGRGCEECKSKGYRGRVGLYEYWELQPETQKIIASRAGESAIRDSALHHGFKPLLTDALAKVQDGMTTLEELKRVIALDQIRRYASH